MKTCFYCVSIIAVSAFASPLAAAPENEPLRSGLSVWLDAQSVEQAASLNEGRVRGWSNEVAGVVKGAGQPRGKHQPLLAKAGGHPVVRFDGEDDFLHLSALQLKQHWSLFFVVTREAQTKGGSAWRGLFCGDTDTFSKVDVTQASLFVPNGDRAFQYVAESPREDLSVPSHRVYGDLGPRRTHAFDLVHVQVQSGADARMTLRVNGELIDSRELPRESRDEIEWGTGYFLGQGGHFDKKSFSRFFRGGIGEVLVYQRGLREWEAFQVEHYLAGKYAVPLPPRPPLTDLSVWIDPASHATPEAEYEVTELALYPAASVRNEGEIPGSKLRIFNPNPVTKPRHKPKRFDGSHAFRFEEGDGWTFQGQLEPAKGFTLAATTTEEAGFQIINEWPAIQLGESGFAGDLHELLHYSSRPSDEQIEQARQYLTNRHQPPSDPRRFANGGFVFNNGYIDQPYVTVCDDGSWLCAMTTSNFSEHAGDFYLLTTKSYDEGKTWTRPVAAIEPPTLFRACWVTLTKTPEGRIYAFYNLKDSRGDVRGNRMFCYRWSDDHGETWSAERGEIPLEKLDHEADFVSPNGWSVCPPFHRDGKTYLAFSRYVPPGRTEGRGFVYSSPDLLSVERPETASWERLPREHQGLRSEEIGGSYQEEHIVLPLSKPGELYVIWRTAEGFPIESYSRDDGETWSEPRYATLGGKNGPPLRQPLACTLPTRLKDGRYLLWYHNASGPERSKIFLPRNVVWASLGEERAGEIVWSQPEIVTYGYKMPANTLGMSYPGVLEHENGDVTFFTTDKMTARHLRFPASKVKAMGRQLSGETRAAKDVVPLSAGAKNVSVGKGFAIHATFDFHPTRKDKVLFEVAGRSGKSRITFIQRAADKSLWVRLADERGRLIEHKMTNGSLKDGERYRFSYIFDQQAGLGIPILNEVQAPPFGKEGKSWKRLPEDWSLADDLSVKKIEKEVVVQWEPGVPLLSDVIAHQRALE